MAATPKPPLHPLTADDRGAIIIIIAYAWIFITALAAAIRFGLAWSNRLHLKKDDFAFALGVALAVASSICFHVAGNNGLGKKMAKVPLEDLDIYYKSMYAGELVGITAQWLAKVSFLQLSDRVAPREPRPYNIVFGMITFWGVFSILVIALQCGLPDPWVYVPDDCPTKGYMYYPVIILNIITDIVLSTWILPTLWKLLMDADRRILVVILFGSRLICVTHLSVLQATIPRTKRFIAALQLRTHATVRLTEFELGLPTDPTYPTMPGKDTDDSFGSSEATTTKPEEVHPRSRSHSHARSGSHSPARSMRSEQPLVPLQLTPSTELCFTTEIIAEADARSHDAKRSSRKYDNHDWKKYLRRSKGEDDMNVSSMFSWKSRTSFARERIVQTKEVTQKVEVVQPKESRWTFRRQSEGSKRHSVGQT
ncbi:hypothetical protein N0V90_012947 [Kalmusia sp. IMI 367209]|nr:hypothetical protein N0V90_012947 [Kalmusia sp. IMI 367209]